MNNEAKIPEYISALPQEDANVLLEIQKMIPPVQRPNFDQACEGMYVLAKNCLQPDTNTTFLASLMTPKKKLALRALQASNIGKTELEGSSFGKAELEERPFREQASTEDMNKHAQEIIAEKLLKTYEKYGKSAEVSPTIPDGIAVGTKPPITRSAAQ